MTATTPSRVHMKYWTTLPTQPPTADIAVQRQHHHHHEPQPITASAPNDDDDDDDTLAMNYRPHKHVPNKERVLAGYKSALKNPSTASEGRAHARKQLIKRGRIFDAFFSTSFNTRIRRSLRLRVKSRK